MNWFCVFGKKGAVESTAEDYHDDNFFSSEFPVSFDLLAPARLALRANLRLSYLACPHRWIAVKIWIPVISLCR